jgi:WD40 repeat protein
MTMRALTIPSVNALTWTPDNRQFIGVEPAGTIRFWDAATGEMTRVFGTDASPLCAAAWSHDGLRLATANRAGVIEIRDAATGKKSQVLVGETGPVAKLAWSPDGRKLAATGENRTVRVWDLATSKEVLHRGSPWVPSEDPEMAWSSGSRWLLVKSPSVGSTGDWLVEVWDTETGRQALDLYRVPGVRAVLWSPTADRFATLGADGKVGVWDPESSRETLSLNATATAVAWDADGKRLLAFCRAGTVKLWDAVTGDEAFDKSVSDTNERPPILGGSWSPDGRRLALADPQGTIRIWEAATGNSVLTGRTPPGTRVVPVWSPDGRRLATASTDDAGKGTIQVWNLADGREALRQEGLQHHPQLTGATWLGWSPDGRQLAAALIDGTIPIWDVATGAAAFNLSGFDTLRSATGPGGRPEPDPAGNRRSGGKTLADWVLWSPTGHTLAVVGVDGTIPVKVAATGREAFKLGTARSTGQPPEPVALVVASPDGRSLASSSRTGTVKLWQGATGHEIRVLEDGPSQVTSFAWSPDGRRLAWRSVSNKVQVTDANGREVFATRARGGPAGSWETILTWSPDGKRVASSGPGGLQVWDTEAGAAVLDIQGHWGTQRDLLAWSPDGGRLAAVGTPGVANKERAEQVKIWDANTGKELRTLPSGVKASGIESIRLLNWSGDGRWISGARTDGLIKVWETATGKESFELRAIAQGGPPGRGFVPRLAWNPDGRRLAAVTGEGTIQIHDVVLGKDVFMRDDQAGQIAALAWSPDGHAIASSSSPPVTRKVGEGDLVKVRDGATGKTILSVGLQKAPVRGLAWSPDGKRLAAVSTPPNGADLRVWEVSTNKEKLHVDWAVSDCWPVWAPGGQGLVAIAPGKARVWDLGVGKETMHLSTLSGLPPSSDPRAAVAWNSDGTRLAAASDEWTLKVWDATSGKEMFSLGRAVGTLPLGTELQNVAVLAWSADGRRLATSAPIDRTIKIWDAASGTTLIACRQQGAPLRALAWAPDGKRLASAGEDATVKVWDPATGELIGSFEYVFEAAPGRIPPKPRDAGLLAWGHDGRRLAMAGEDNAVRIWDTTTGEKVTYYGHSASVSSVAWSPNGKRLATASVDGTLKLWDAATGHEVLGLGVEPDPGRPLGSLAWSPDGSQLALFRPTGSVTVWAVDRGAD